MGIGASRYFRLKSDKASKETKCMSSYDVPRNITALKNDVLLQLKETCIKTHVGKGGVAFYAALKNEDNTAYAEQYNNSSCKPNVVTKRHSDALANSFTAMERGIMAEVIKADRLREKGRCARQSDERRKLAMKRREMKDIEMKRKYLEKIRQVEVRRQADHDMLKHEHSEIRDFYQQH